MNSQENFKIIEFDNLNLKQNHSPNKRVKINLFLILILILFILFIIIIYFLFLTLKKNIDHIIKYNYNKEIQNKKIINKLDFIGDKLQVLKQKAFLNKKEITNYKNNSIYYMLSIKEVLGYKKIRVGRNFDGGYILLNDLKNIKFGYSFGISRELSFDKELADKNIDVFMYDHTIDKLFLNNSRFHWKKIGLTGRNTTKKNMKTLSELIEENGHSNENNMILKMDIESYEWDVLQNLPIKNLLQFKYIVGEFHFFSSGKINYYKILKKLQETHQIFHIHCNNCEGIIELDGSLICSALEISFVQKEGYNFIEDKNIYPIKGLDYNNCQKRKDISNLINLFNINFNN